jgi:hypothetical protein
MAKYSNDKNQTNIEINQLNQYYSPNTAWPQCRRGYSAHNTTPAEEYPRVLLNSTVSARPAKLALQKVRISSAATDD